MAPKFMINDVPTSPPLVVEEEVPSKHCTVESFVGTAPAASIHVSHSYVVQTVHIIIVCVYNVVYIKAVRMMCV